MGKIEYNQRQSASPLQGFRIPFALLILVAAAMTAVVTVLRVRHGDFARTAAAMGTPPWFQWVLLGTKAAAILGSCMCAWLILRLDFRLVPALIAVATLAGGLSSEFGRSYGAWVDWLALVTTWVVLVGMVLVILICLHVIRPGRSK